MSVFHILQVNQAMLPKALLAYNEQSHDCQIQTIEHWSAPQLRQQPLILILPAQWTYCTETQVPSKNPEVLQQSIPFAIEEQLSNELEDNHFAFNPLTERSQKVAVIEQQQLNQLKQKLDQNGISVLKIYPENHFYPTTDDSILLWRDHDENLICFGQHDSMKVQDAQVTELIGGFAQNYQFIQSNVKLDPTTLPEQLEIKPQIELADCCQHLLNSSPVNLKPAAWNQKKQRNKTQKRRFAMLLAIALIVSWIGISGYRIINLNREIADLKQQQSTLFTQQFKDAANSELLDPYAAFQSRLKRLNSGSTTNHSIFLTAIDAIGKAYQGHQNQITPQALRLNDDKLELQVTASSLTQINNFQRSLQNAAGKYKVLIGLNEQDQGQYKSVITMEPL